MPPERLPPDPGPRTADALQGLVVPFALMPVFMLMACTEAPFEFRGYTERSNCRQVIDAELARGSNFESAYESADPSVPGLVTELTGTIFDVPVRIEVTCARSGGTVLVHYISPARDPAETAAVFSHFATELEAAYGAPAMITSDERRSLHFLCDEPSPVLLEEWKLGEDTNEVYLAIVPGAAPCVTEPGA